MNALQYALLKFVKSETKKGINIYLMGREN